MHSPEILVIDGEPMLVCALRRSLLRAGYRCEVATDLGAARALFRRRGRSAAAALVDWDLPGRAAPILADELWTLRPELPIVLSCGFAPWALPPAVRARPFHGLLPKPFGPEDLLGAIAEAVGRGGGARALAR